jgi:hypothetical protein
MVALAEGQLQLLGEVEDHLPAGFGTAGLHEAQVTGGDVGLDGEVHLAHPPTFPPLAEKFADWPGHAGAGHALHDNRPGHGETITVHVMRTMMLSCAHGMCRCQSKML